MCICCNIITCLCLCVPVWISFVACLLCALLQSIVFSCFLFCFKSSVLPPYGKLLINRHRIRRRREKYRYTPGNSVKSNEVFSRQHCIADIHSDTNLYYDQTFSNKYLSEIHFIAAKIKSERGQNWINSAFQVTCMGYAQ